MTRGERWSFNLLGGLVTVTGAAYLVMKYAMTTDDPFALVNHPWQPLMLSLHVVSAPAFMLLFGMILRSHILGKLRARQRTHWRSGWTSLVSLGLMAGSGYLLQVVTMAGLQPLLVVLHVASSAAFVAAYLTHLALGATRSSVPLLRAMRRPASASAPEAAGTAP